MSDEFFGQVFRTGTPILMAEVTADQLRQQIKPEYHIYLERFPVHSVLAVPLRARGRAIGTLMVGRHLAESAYGLDDQDFLQELADRAALGIANARLFTEAERQVRRRGRCGPSTWSSPPASTCGSRSMSSSTG